MKRKAALYILLIALFITSLTTSAYAVTIFPLEGQGSAHFPYTKEDEARYQAIYEGAYSSAPEDQKIEWEYLVQHNIDYFAQIDKKEYTNYPAVFAVPDETAISRETAIYSAYAAMEQLFDYSDEMLIAFCPVCSYNVKDPENPSWYIIFYPIEKVLGYQYYFSVFVNAWDSRILEITDNSGSAVG